MRIACVTTIATSLLALHLSTASKQAGWPTILTSTANHDLRLNGSRGVPSRVAPAMHGYTAKGVVPILPTSSTKRPSIPMLTPSRAIVFRFICIDLDWYHQCSIIEELEFNILMADGGIPLYKHRHEGVLTGKSKRIPIEKRVMQATKVITGVHRTSVTPRYYNAAASTVR